MREMMLANLPFGIVVALCIIVAFNHVRLKELEKWKKKDDKRRGL